MRTRVALLIALTFLVPSASRAAMATWRRIDPPMLSSASMAFDSYHRRFLLFGGETIRGNGAGGTVKEIQGRTYVADLVAGEPWTELTLAPSPPARAGALTIYDAKRDRFVVAGGRDLNGDPYSDVWAFEFTPVPHWTLLGDNVTLPPPVYDGVLAFLQANAPTTPALYDSVGDRMVAFARGKMFQLSLAGLPLGTFDVTSNMPFLNGASIAADFPNGKIYAVQGYDPYVGSLPGDVWELQLSTLTWVRHSGVGSHPGHRLECAFAFDPAGNRLVLAGGYYDTQYDADTRPSGFPRLLYSFALDGSDTWTVSTPAGAPPYPARQSATAFDPVTRSLLVYGGYAWPDFYTYQPTTPGGVQEPELYGLTIDSPAWSAWAPPGIMEARFAATSAVDPAQRRWFVYGGRSVFYGSGQYNDDLFEVELDRPGGWTRVAHGPALSSPCMTFTGTSLVVVGGNPTETWRMDVSGGSRVWSRIAQSGAQPPWTTDHTTIYDPARARVLLFQKNLPFTVWQLTPGDASPEWGALATQPTTPDLTGVSAVWDSAGDRAILPDGGWALDFGTDPPTWVQLSISGTPPDVPGHATAWDAKRRKVLTFGGHVRGIQTSSSARLAQLDPDTGAWSDLPADGTASLGRDDPVSAFDPKLDRWIIASSTYAYYSPTNDAIEPDNQVYVLWMDSSTPTRLSFAGSREQADGVRLRWFGDDAGSSLRVWRRNEGVDAVVVGHALSIEPGLFEFTDRSVVSGIRYGYRLEGSDGSFTEEEWIDAPVNGLALAPPSPNPGRVAWSIAWTQPRIARTELSVIDAAGRRVLERTWSALPAGRHAALLDGSERLSAGLYFLVLRSGGETSVRRAVRL